MLAAALNIIVPKLAAMNLFTKIYELVDITTDGEKTFPAHHIGGGQFEPIEYDSTAGMCYFRTNGKIQLNEITDESKRTTSCAEPIYRMVVPLKLIAFIPKSKAPCDNAFGDHYFASEIISTLTQNQFALPVKSGSFISTGYETDNMTVLKGEYSKPMKDLNYAYSYLSIDWNLELIASVSCLKTKCE